MCSYCYEFIKRELPVCGYCHKVFPVKSEVVTAQKAKPLIKWTTIAFISAGCGLISSIVILLLMNTFWMPELLPLADISPPTTVELVELTPTWKAH